MTRAALIACLAWTMTACSAVLELDELEKGPCVEGCDGRPAVRTTTPKPRDGAQTTAPGATEDDSGARAGDTLADAGPSRNDEPRVSEDAATSPPADAGASGDAADAVDAARDCTRGCGPRAACVANACTPARRVFVSSTGYGASFGGARAADAECQKLAGAAALGGAWMAWVSDGTTSPRGRFTRASLAYRLIDGTLVASDFVALTSGVLAHGIDRDERGALRSNAEVWTATSSSGALQGIGCGGFTSTSPGAPYAAVGITGRTSSSWSNAYQQFCDRTGLGLYCVEQ